MDILFLIKKWITFFVEPLGLILTLATIGLYFLYKSSYLKAKILLSFSLCLLLIFSYPPVANNLIKQLESQYPKYNATDDIQYIHVLGAGHHDNSQHPISSNIGSSSLKRTIEAVRIFKQAKNQSIKLIFTGYFGTENTTSNAVINAEIAKIAGINPQNIIINGQPKDTQEESVFARNIIGNKPFVLVTSASHMPRAIKLFENMGLRPIAAPTDFKTENRGFLSAPNIKYLAISNKAIHEYLGIIWRRITTVLR